MAIRKIMVPVHGRAGDRERVIVASLAAARLSASMEVVFLRHDPREALPLAAGYLAKDIADRLADALKREDAAAEARARATIDEISADPPLTSVAFVSFPGSIEEVVVGRARAADLMVASPYRADEPTEMRRARDAALFESGRPVLIAPPIPPAAIGSRCLVAWDGSAVATRAVQAALPFLASAETVTILVVEAEGPPVRDAEEIAAYLGLHWAEASIVRAPVSGGIGETLVEAAGQIDADLLVMGAYGHAWLREHVLGGTTRHVMLETGIAVLVAH